MSNNEDVDGDLLDLLDQLNDRDAAVEDQIGEYIGQESSEKADQKSDQIAESSGSSDEVINRPEEEAVMTPVDYREYSGAAGLPTELTDQTIAQPPIDTKKYIDRIDDVTDEILSACRNDRKEAQDTIDLLRGEVQKAVNAGNNPARMWVDGLVKAVEVKSNINMTAVKALEASVKTIAALRAGGGINILNQQNVGNGPDLAELLSQPAGDEW